MSLHVNHEYLLTFSFFLFCLSYTSETRLRILEPLYQPWIPCSISFYNFCLPLWVPHKLTSFNTILEPSYYTWIPCSSIFLSHSSLSHTMITNWDIHNCLQYMSYIISQIKYMLIISHKQISPLIVLSINTPKTTRGLDVLSISPFLVIDDNPIKAFKKIFNKAFEFSDLVRAPP